MPGEKQLEQAESVRLYARVRKLEAALLRLKNPEHTPETEEAALLQIEVQDIASRALEDK